MPLTQNIYLNVPAWSNTTYAAGTIVTTGGNGYVTPNGGTSTAAPTGTGTGIAPGGVATWNWISTVDFASSDVSALQTWANSLPATLTQPVVGRVVAGKGNSITGTSGVPFLSLSGHTTTSSNSITLQALSPFGFRDTLRGGTGALAFNAANGAAFVLPSGAGGINYFSVADNFVTFDGLQFQDPNSTSGSTILQSSATFTLQNCIVDGFSQDFGAFMIEGALTGASSSVFTMRNCLIVDRGTTGNFISTVQSNYNSVFANNTFIQINAPANLLGLHITGAGGTTFSVTNNIFFGWTAGNVIGSDTGSTGTVSNSVTDVGSFTGTGVTTGTGNLFNKTAANQFVSATTNFRLKIGSDALNSGATDTTDVPSATDILGTSRPQGSAWDIGAYEMPGASSTGTATGSAAVSGRGVAEVRSVGTITGASTAAGGGPVGSNRTVTAVGTATVSAAGAAASVAVGTITGSATVVGSNSTGSIAATISINPISPQAALTPFPVTGTLTLQPQLQFSVDSSPVLTPVPPTGMTPLGGVGFSFTHPGAGIGKHALTLQDLTTGAATAAGFLVDLIGSETAVFPPLGPTSLQTIIPAYLYQEYFDDDDLQAFIAAYNSLAQGYLDWMNSINLPIYTSSTIAGPLLDWVAEGVYGMKRPTIAISNLKGFGPFNTWVTNTLAFNAGGATGSNTIFNVTDEVFKRILTWHIYKGDGRQFTVPWLKRRVTRFIGGVAGADFPIDQTQQVSVSFPSSPANGVTITISSGPVDTTYAPIFQAAVATGVLELPFQLAFNVLIQ